MKINDIKENRIFQIFICIMVASLMLYVQLYTNKVDVRIERNNNEIEKIII